MRIGPKRLHFVVFVVPLVISCPTRSRAAFEGELFGADAGGISVTGVSLVDPLFVPFVNPAAPFDRGGWRLSSFYSRRFAMRELTHVSCSGSASRGGTLWSFGLDRFGDARYGEELAVAGVGVQLAARTRVGVGARLHRLRIEGYGSALAPGFDLAWSCIPAGKTRIGAVWRNLNHPRLGISRAEIPGGLVVGMSGQVGRRAVWTVEGKRAILGEVAVGVGFAFSLSRELTMRVGFQRETGEYSLGAALHLPFVRWDYAVSLHPSLGVTHYVSLSVGDRLEPPRLP
jgi:hypothetical protein